MSIEPPSNSCTLGSEHVDLVEGEKTSHSVPSAIAQPQSSAALLDAQVPKNIRNMRQATWICVLLSLLPSIFLFALDNTVVADVQPRIIYTFGDIDKLPWVSVSYALGAIAVNLFVSKLFGQFNNKYVFLTGVVRFEVGSAICGAAPTMNALIIGRSICGVGGTCIYVGVINLISVLTTEAKRPIYLSFVGLMWGLGTVLGPIIGGAFAVNSATWRWSFYLNLCVGVVVAPAYIFLLPSYNPRPGLSMLSRVRELDLVGAVLNAGAFATLVMAIAFGGNVYAWSSGQTIGFFVCSGFLWVIFVLQQTFAAFTTKENRLFPVAFIRSWEMDILFAQIAAGVVVVFIPIYFIPLYFQFLRNITALNAGVYLLLFVFFQGFGVIISGIVMGKIGYYMPWYLAGGLLSLIGGALLRTTTVDTSASIIYSYSILLGFGSGLFVQASYPIAHVKVAPKLIPIATAFIGCGQISGATVALAVSNSVFLNQATSKVTKILPLIPRTTVQQAISGADGVFFNTLNAQDRAAVLDAVTQSINHVYNMVIAAGAVVVTLSLFTKREKIFLTPAAGNGIRTNKTETI